MANWANRWTPRPKITRGFKVDQILNFKMNLKFSVDLIRESVRQCQADGFRTIWAIAPMRELFVWPNQSELLNSFIHCAHWFYDSTVWTKQSALVHTLWSPFHGHRWDCQHDRSVKRNLAAPLAFSGALVEPEFRHKHDRNLNDGDLNDFGLCDQFHLVNNR